VHQLLPPDSGVGVVRQLQLQGKGARRVTGAQNLGLVESVAKLFMANFMGSVHYKQTGPHAITVDPGSIAGGTVVPVD
jgi:hypothetical protein